jgi:ankyrin repeat protein
MQAKQVIETTLRELHETSVEKLSHDILEGVWSNRLGPQNESVLHYISMLGRLDLAQCAIENGVSVNSYDNDRCTPLHCAASTGNAGMVQLLVQHGAVLDEGDLKTGHTPLHCAAVRDHINVIQVLLEAGANINITNEIVDEPIIEAIASKKENASLFLIQSGCNINVQANHADGQSPLQLSMMCELHTVTRELLSHGANLSHRDSNNYTVLHYACGFSTIDIVQFLLSQCAQDLHVKAINPPYDTPITVTRFRNDPQQVLKLL